MRRAILIACLTASACAPEQYARRQVYSMLESRHENTVVQEWDISCGAAALATLLTYGHHYPVGEREVAAAMLERTSTEKVRRQLGFSLLDLKRYAVAAGFQADGYGDLTLSDLEQFGPSIVPIEVRGGMSHFVIYRGVVGDRVFLTDPAWGNRTMTVDQFERIWEGRNGFKVADRDGLNEPNGLSPRPQELWASSEPLPVFPRLAELKLPEPFQAAAVEPLTVKAAGIFPRFAAAEPPQPFQATHIEPLSVQRTEVFPRLAAFAPPAPFHAAHVEPLVARRTEMFPRFATLNAPAPFHATHIAPPAAEPPHKLAKDAERAALRQMSEWFDHPGHARPGAHDNPKASAIAKVSEIAANQTKALHQMHEWWDTVN
jgi:predicted double-glycine peptidase